MGLKDNVIELPKDVDLKTLPAPTLTSIMMSGTSLTPTKVMLVILGADVTVTIDGVSINLLQNFTLLLKPNITYEFSTSIALGVN